MRKLLFCLSIMSFCCFNAKLRAENLNSYEMGAAVGKGLSSGFSQMQDASAINQILRDANATDDPEVIEDAIRRVFTQVSPERQPGIIAYLQGRCKKLEEKQAMGHDR